MFELKKTIAILGLAGAFLSPLYAGEAEDLYAKIADASVDRRANLTKDIIAMGDDALEDTISALDSETLAIKEAAARVLGQIGGADNISTLKDLLANSQEENLKVAAIDGLVALLKSNPDKGQDVASAILPGDEEGMSLLERYARYRAAASLKVDSATSSSIESKLKGLIAPDEVSALAAVAIEYFGRKADEASQKLLLDDFINQMKAKEGGKEGEEIWAFEGEGWDGLRVVAVCYLVDAGHADSSTLLANEIERGRRVAPMLSQRLAKAASKAKDLAPKLIEKLKENPNSTIRNTISDVLAEMGTEGLQALLALYDEGEAERKAAAATDPGARNKHEATYRTGVERAAKIASARPALLELFRTRISQASEPDTKDDAALMLFDALTSQPLVASKAPELRETVLICFRMANAELKRKALDKWPPVSRGGDNDIIRLHLLKHEDVEVRKRLTEQLSNSQISAFRAQALLLDLAKDEDASVRKEVWKGLNRSDDFAVFDAYEDAFKNESDEEVAVEAASTLGGYLAGVKIAGKNIWDDESEDARERAHTLVLETVKGKGAAARGILQSFNALISSLYKNDRSGGNEIKDLVKDFLDSDDASMRQAVLQIPYTLLGADDKDFLEKVAKLLISEEDGVSAYHAMNTLRNHIAKLSSDTQSALIAPCVKWLGTQSIRDSRGTFRNPANEAGELLGRIGSKTGGNKFMAVRNAVKAAIDKAISEFPGSDQSNIVAYGLDALRVMSSSAEVEYILEKFESLKADNTAQMRRGLVDYMKEFAESKHLDRIKKIKGITQGNIDQITRRINRREPTKDEPAKEDSGKK